MLRNLMSYISALFKESITWQPSSWQETYLCLIRTDNTSLPPTKIKYQVGLTAKKKNYVLF